MTYEQLQIEGLENSESRRETTLRYYPQDFRANRIRLRERVWAIATAVICGERLQELSEKCVRSGSSVKILPVYSQEKISGIFEESLTTYPRWGIQSVGEYGELATSARLISETGCSSSLGTPNLAEFVEKFPTPLSSDAIRVRYSEESLRKVGELRTQGEYKLAGCNLSEYAAVYPTPMASGWRNEGSRNRLKKLQDAEVITETERKQMIQGNGGKLNPTWVEWLMGFPLGWTDLDA